MNSRYAGAVHREAVTKPRSEALFAAGVYRDDDDDEPNGAAKGEIAQLRAELRGEAAHEGPRRAPRRARDAPRRGE